MSIPQKFSDSQLSKNYFDQLSSKPYCTDTIGEKGYLIIRPKNKAIEYPYIQANPIHRLYWIILDLDYDARYYWYDHDPTPNMTIGNPVNNHQHILYLIDPAVYTLRNSREAPRKLAAAVERGLALLFQADPAFGNLASKNPYHTKWETYVWHERAWGLKELLESVPDKYLKRKTHKPSEEIGLGRNCTLFELSRKFAYGEYRKLKYDEHCLFDNVYDYALGINYGFNPPLGEREVRCITRSVSKWTVRHHTPEGMKRWGETGRKKSITVRHIRSQTRADEIIIFKDEHPNMSNRMLAKVFDCDEATIRRALS